MTVRIQGRTSVPATRVLVPTWLLKTAMALTGALMAAFVVVHMVGNLKIFLGAGEMDAYAAWLREVGEPVIPYGGVLWIFRVVLLACLLVHAAAALILWRRGVRTGTRGARGLAARGWGARLMMPTGLLLLAFVVVHLLDLTIGRLVASGSFRHPDPGFHAAANVAASLGRPLMATFYLLVLVALALHLAHGLHLAWQDVGGAAPRSRRVARVVARLVALAILLGDGAVVIASWAGVV